MGDNFEVDRWMIDLAEIGRHSAFSAELEQDEALGVVGTLHGDGRVYGRGSLDPQSAVAG